MTPDQINTAIAAIVGTDQLWMIKKRWLYYRPHAAGYTDRTDQAWKLPLDVAKKHEYLRGEEPVTLVKAPVPDYFHDLNAIHEAEKTLANQFNTLEEAYWRNLQHVQPHPIYATAPQRCQAFLRAHGKWRDA